MYSVNASLQRSDTNQWTRFKITPEPDPESESIARGSVAQYISYRDIWIQGPKDVACRVFKEECNIDPELPVCPCPRHPADEIAITQHEGGAEMLLRETREDRGAIIGPNGREHRRRANPRTYRTPRDRENWEAEHPYFNLARYIGGDNYGALFIFAHDRDINQAQSARRQYSDTF